MSKKSVKDIDIKGKRVLCRVDFNVPLEKGIITDDTRIRASLPTISYMVNQGAKVILLSHLGRPKGQVKEELRLDPVAKRLGELLNQKVYKTDEALGEQVQKQVQELKEGEVLLLENIRFYPEEEQNDPHFAKQLAELGEVYVNDAFGVAHRAHASTEGVARFLPAVAGLLMQQELEVLGGALAQPKRPFTAIIGGAKVKDKISVMENLLDKVDYLLIGGGMANTFVKAEGYSVGRSLLEEDKVALARALLDKAKASNIQFFIPEDCVVADRFAQDAQTKVVPIDQIPEEWQVLDIGPKTVDKYRKIILQSNLVIWNGPMGVFELDPFAWGTKSIATALADCNGTTIVGGGDSAAALKKCGLTDAIDHISTGGGASLELMEGKILPGVAVLDDR